MSILTFEENVKTTQLLTHSNSEKNNITELKARLL